MSPEEEQPEPVTAAMAAARLKLKPATIRCWARRYAARKQGTDKNRTVYDWHDLKTIDACINAGRPVPATPEERDTLRPAARAAA
ncbi:hypothetical protein ABZ897_00730 [Nonomuraea sp. NPDC046802]|uniref:MerR family transcriptional regulator n=1 Tax=Nonomuraea sp. NPDC046802 TaxID=3154919 RepID=UPI0033F6A81B